MARTLTVTRSKETRIYTLTKGALDEVRTFAAYAFRKDKTNRRRYLFTSAFFRRRNRKQPRDAAAEVESETAVIAP